MTHSPSKRRFKIRYLFLLVLAVPIALNIVYQYHTHRSYDVTVGQIPIPKDSVSLLKGKVVSSLCTACHGADLGGKKCSENFFLGSVYAPNITSGKGSVTRDFTDKDWIRIIHHSVRRDGKAAQGEWRYDFSARELGELIAYLKVLPPIDRESHAIERTFIGETVAGLAIILNPDFLMAKKIDHTASYPTQDYITWTAVDLNEW